MSELKLEALFDLLSTKLQQLVWILENRNDKSKMNANSSTNASKGQNGNGKSK